MSISVETGRLFVIGANIFLIGTSLGLLAASGLVLLRFDACLPVVIPTMAQPARLVLAAACLLFVSGVVGLVAACNNGHTLVLLAVLFDATAIILQIIAAILVLSVTRGEKDVDKWKMRRYLETYEEHTEEVDELHRTFNCCIAEAALPSAPSGTDAPPCAPLPPTCCVGEGEEGQGCTDCSGARRKGDCVDALHDFLYWQKMLLVAVAVGTTPIEMFAIQPHLCFRFQLKYNRRGR